MSKLGNYVCALLGGVICVPVGLLLGRLANSMLDKHGLGLSEDFRLMSPGMWNTAAGAPKWVLYLIPAIIISAGVYVAFKLAANDGGFLPLVIAPAVTAVYVPIAVISAYVICLAVGSIITGAWVGMVFVLAILGDVIAPVEYVFYIIFK